MLNEEVNSLKKYTKQAIIYYGVLINIKFLLSYINNFLALTNSAALICCLWTIHITLEGLSIIIQTLLVIIT